jgi:hypothetical protein
MIAVLVAAAALSTSPVPPPIPTITVTGASGSARMLASPGCTIGPGVAFCSAAVSPFENAAVPTMRVTAGETLALAPDAGLTASDGSIDTGPDRTIARGSDGKATVPADSPGVAYLLAGGRWAAQDWNGDAGHALRLEIAPPPTGKASEARVQDARVRWTVACPKTARAPCSAKSTVRVHGLVAASKSYTRLAPGERRTLTARVRPPAMRYLNRHPRASLRATAR